MSTKAIHIKVIQESELYLRGFHFTKALTGTNEVEYAFGDMSEGYTHHLSDKSDDGITELGQTLINQMILIDGVIGGVVKKYSILIKIGEAFNQKDVYPIVLWKIIRVLFPEEIGKKILVSTAVIKDLSKKLTEVEEENDDDEFTSNFKEILIFEREEVEVVATSKQIDIEHLFKKKPRVNLKTVHSKRSKEVKSKRTD